MNSLRRLVCCAHVVVGLGIVAALANCGGGERPPPAGDAPVDPSVNASADSGASPVNITGYDPLAGVVFGEDGFVNCGSQAADKVLTIRNPTNDIINFKAKLTAGSTLFRLNPEEGGIPVRGQATLQIIPNPIPQVSDVAPDLYAGTIEVQFQTGEPPSVIRLHQTARGAIVKTTVLSSVIDFGSVKVNTDYNQLFSLTNSGNAEVTASFQLGTQQFKIDGAPSTTAKLAGGATTSKTVTFNPNAVQSFTDTLAVSFNSSAVHCQPPPGNVNLKGTGTTSVAVAPAALDFAKVNCGDTAGFQPVNISSTVAMVFTPTLAGGTTKFTLTDNTGAAITAGVPINLAANTPYVLRVVPKTIPIPSVVTPNALGDTLTITTNVPLDTPHAVALLQTAQGSIFSFGQTSITNNGSINQVFNNALTLINNGNSAGNYVIAVAPSETFTSNLSTGSAQVGTTTGTLSATLPSTFNTTVPGSVTLTAPGTVLCANLPPVMPLQAQTGGGTSITLDKGALTFGQVDCGTAAAFQTITMTSIVNTTITPNLTLGTSSPFTIADSAGAGLTLGAPIALTANVAYAMRVVPKTIAIPSSTAVNALGDSLTITSGVDPQKTIPLNQTARGAIFTFTPLSISGTNGSIYSFSLINGGNAPGQYTLSSSAGTTSLTTGTTSPGTLSGTLNKSSAGTISLTTTSVRCSDVPPPITVVTPP